ncbi:unnamed protein product [Dibothriocephalus latus]|uniref:Alpha-D-phosphohexomutase alpha/beta/alpha domain-containing protein n=1 Tax=Dibothriocephalus latus TaxID=60516 RepID=A0A3P7LDL7_DIBLA|nr:unnamed protein product [Dibothriocephalus latus]
MNGNETATLLGWWIWTQWRKRNPTKDLSKVYMVSSTVSSKILRSIAQKEGFNFEETLTGFKWIANKAYDLMTKNPGTEVIFAFEEAIGFMSGTTVLDKDGIGALAAVCEMTSHLYAQKSSLVQQLEKVFDTNIDFAVGYTKAWGHFIGRADFGPLSVHVYSMRRWRKTKDEFQLSTLIPRFFLVLKRTV